MPKLKHTLPTVAQSAYIRPSLPMYSLPNIWDAIWPHVLVVHPGNACSLCAQVTSCRRLRWPSTLLISDTLLFADCYRLQKYLTDSCRWLFPERLLQTNQSGGFKLIHAAHYHPSCLLTRTTDLPSSRQCQPYTDQVPRINQLLSSTA